MFFWQRLLQFILFYFIFKKTTSFGFIYHQQSTNEGPSAKMDWQTPINSNSNSNYWTYIHAWADQKFYSHKQNTFTTTIIDSNTELVKFIVSTQSIFKRKTYKDKPHEALQVQFDWPREEIFESQKPKWRAISRYQMVQAHIHVRK